MAGFGVTTEAQVAVNKLIRDRDARLPCISCGIPRILERSLQNKHARQDEVPSLQSLRPMRDLQPLQRRLTFEYSLALDRKFGKGWALLLERLSRKIEP